MDPEAIVAIAVAALAAVSALLVALAAVASAAAVFIPVWRRLKSVDEGQTQIVELVNGTHNALTSRVETLTQTLQAAGVAIPPDPTVQQPKAAP